MINELYPLFKAMERAGIAAQSWHRKYKPIPNISDKAPCLRVILSNGKISEIATVEKELGARLRKYGSNLGTFPCCNLAPLYRVTDESVKKSLRDLQAGKPGAFDLAEILSWRTNGNWGRKFRKKCAISMRAVPAELREMLEDGMAYAPLQTLLDEAVSFAEPQALYDALEAIAVTLLEQRTNVALALRLLFHAGDADKSAEDDTGALSVAFDSRKLIDEGVPAVSEGFTQAFNQALLEVDAAKEGLGDATVRDAFGLPFTPLEEPMPTAKLAGGFEVTLRTMFGAVRCQSRYGRVENASYPISPGLRLDLQAALNWLGDAERKYKTWMNTDRDEILFAYPHTLPKTNAQFIRAFKRVPNSEASFEKEAEALVSDLRGLHPNGARAHEDRLSVFILRKIDKGRAKVLYTRVTDPGELKNRADAWSRGCRNLPGFPFGQPRTPFPVDIADTLNRAWKQDGMVATDRFKPMPHYRGMELLMEKDAPVTQDMALLARGCIDLMPHLGALLVNDRDYQSPIWWKVKEMLALCGLLLDRLNVRKERYMEEFPYLYGQWLKISDELHILYCKAVRKGEVPPQLAGSGLVQAATEAPIRTLRLLGQRMMPYVTWAKSYRYQGVMEKDRESWRAGWLMGLYESAAKKLCDAWTEPDRLTDSEKAQLFLGFIAALPQKDKPGEQPQEGVDNTHNDAKETEENRHE